MSENLLLLHQPAELSPLRVVADAVDYCQCNRGPVIGVVSHTQDRMWFFPLGSRTGDDVEHSPELRCLDCVADTAQRLASGAIAAEYKAASLAHVEALHASQRASQISVAPQPRQTSPSKGDQVT